MIALITDFGSGDHYGGVMKGVIKSIDPGAEIIDITHDIEPFNVRNAQFILASSYRYFPRGTVFLVVVDPGVGSERRCLAVNDGTHCYVLPDNGIISAVDGGSLRCVELAVPEGASKTFHGRDVFAPAAARLSRGERIDELGAPSPSFIKRDFPPVTVRADGIDATVLHVDRFGNVVISIPSSMMGRVSGKRIRAGRSAIIPRPVGHFDQIGEGAAGLYPGSAGFLELAYRRDSLAAREGIRVGDEVTVDG
ncbi:MAG: SAM-dependent chlorinase/fluorinase [Spirochaetes bacterium]|nr:SAM-dependent chlorinase/fluorinase [Spirochaetota bacterium]